MSRTSTPVPGSVGSNDVARLRVALYKLAALVPIVPSPEMPDHELAELLVTQIEERMAEVAQEAVERAEGLTL